MSFDDFSYHKINEAVFDMIQKLKPEEPKKIESVVDEESLFNEEAFKDSEEDNEAPVQPKEEEKVPESKQKVFKDEDVLDIEEAQEKDAFLDI